MLGCGCLCNQLPGVSPDSAPVGGSPESLFPPRPCRLWGPLSEQGGSIPGEISEPLALCSYHRGVGIWKVPRLGTHVTSS